jgi:hypothetical protein
MLTNITNSTLVLVLSNILSRAFSGKYTFVLVLSKNLTRAFSGKPFQANIQHWLDLSYWHAALVATQQSIKKEEFLASI